MVIQHARCSKNSDQYLPCLTEFDSFFGEASDSDQSSRGTPADVDIRCEFKDRNDTLLEQQNSLNFLNVDVARGSEGRAREPT
jgi:hypothetical protein